DVQGAPVRRQGPGRSVHGRNLGFAEYAGVHPEPLTGLAATPSRSAPPGTHGDLDSVTETAASRSASASPLTKHRITTRRGRAMFVKRDCEGFHRRDFLQIGSAGLLGLTLPTLLRSEAKAGGLADKPKAKGVILV